MINMKPTKNNIETLNEFGFYQCRKKGLFMRKDMERNVYVDFNKDIKKPVFYVYEDGKPMDVNDEPEIIILKEKLEEGTFEDINLW